jgi:hypothetical protein
LKKATTHHEEEDEQLEERRRRSLPSQLIDARIAALNDWRGETLARVRALIKEADPEVVEEWKRHGVPVWSHDGIVCTGERLRTGPYSPSRAANFSSISRRPSSTRTISGVSSTTR